LIVKIIDYEIHADFIFIVTIVDDFTY